MSLRDRKRKSLVELGVELVTAEQRPIHVFELVELLMNHYGRITDRDSLSSALAERGVFVRRVSPATFELIKYPIQEEAMSATKDLLSQMKISRPNHLPVVAAFGPRR